MRLTTKGRYAVTAMLDVAIYSQLKPVSLADVSERQMISLSYLEQLFSKLKKAGLVKSVRGPGGGYCLSREAEAIHIAAIIDAVDETVDATGCAGQGDCKAGETCLTHHLWDDLSQQIYQFLSSISLAGLVNRREVQESLMGNSQNAENSIPLRTIG